MVQEGKAKDAEKQPKTSNTKNYNFGNLQKSPEYLSTGGEKADLPSRQAATSGIITKFAVTRSY